MSLHQRNDREELVEPAAGGPLPKLKVRRGADGKLEVEGPADDTPTHAEVRPDERPAYPDNPAPSPNPSTQVF
ncbi:MAG TPA: hypothetical protein VF549_15355 [Solirubrobacteraceae bacterium]|jgi:hypothetical protein